MDKDLEKILADFEKDCRERDAQMRELWNFRLRHPIRFRKWLKTPEGKKWKLHNLIRDYFCGL